MDTEDVEITDYSTATDKHNFYIAVIFFVTLGICAVLGIFVAVMVILLHYGQAALLHDVIKIGSGLMSGLIAGGALIYARFSRTS